MSKPSTIQGKYSAAGEGNIYARANVATCKITANDTDGTFEIFDEQCKPGFESRLHMHTKSFQVCYVVDGTGEFQLGDQVFHAKKGACVNIPPGVPHKVGSKDGMRMLMVYSPPGLEGMMKAMKALSAEQLADGALTEQDFGRARYRRAGRRRRQQGFRIGARLNNILLSQVVQVGLTARTHGLGMAPRRGNRKRSVGHDPSLLPHSGCHACA